MKKIKTNKFHKLNYWIKTHKKTSVFLAILVIAGASFGVYTLLNKQEQPEISKPKATAPKPAEKYYSPLSGVEVSNEEITKTPVIGVMIENSPAARPQSGLKDSGLVFEAVAEAGITRFLSLYQTEKSDLIGPVRSVRDYYIDWAGGFNSSIAHVGGSPTALARMRDGNNRDLDQSFNEGSFWRSTDRWAPHNVYTDSQKLSDLNNKNGWTSSSLIGFKRKDKKLSEEIEAASNIAINFGQSGYNTSYTYDSSSNTYARFLEGQPSLDREKGQISPTNVVAIKVNMNLDHDGYHNIIQTAGEGEAFVFLDGKVIAATWKKADESSPLLLKDSDGNEIKLNRGQTWVSAVPNGVGSISWQ